MTSTAISENSVKTKKKRQQGTSFIFIITTKQQKIIQFIYIFCLNGTNDLTLFIFAFFKTIYIPLYSKYKQIQAQINIKRRQSST